MKRAALLFLLVAAAAAGCGSGSKPAPVAGADPKLGKHLIEYVGCGACHTIPGIQGADGRIGPSLANYRSQRQVLGILPNTVPNLAKWIQHPQRILPGGIMPNLGLTPGEATDVAAYIDR